MTLRKIIHIDMDAFYASVEMRDNPQLKLRPLAVGGDPSGRGVIATANYQARKYGVRSAMPSWKAKQLCPDLIILHPNFDKYQQESLAIHQILHAFTDIIEPLSLDEAYLDVSQSKFFGGSATYMAKEIRKQIWKERRLTASAGIAPNKFLAKVASEWQKPNGLFTIPPENVDLFVKQLPIEKIYGIGRVTSHKLHALNIYTCEDLRQFDIGDLQHHLGTRAWNLHELCYGIDNRPVQVERIHKSVSVETTFKQDLQTLASCLEHVPELYQKLMRRFANMNLYYQPRKPFVKIKFADFTTTTVESMLYPLLDKDSYQALIRIG